MRTFGIEIECVSKIAKDDLAEKIRQAILPFGHTLDNGNWQRNTTASNKTTWTLKTDGSVNGSPAYPHAVELVTPVLGSGTVNSVDIDIQVLQAVCDVLSRYCTANKSCGLHVHHAVSPTEVAPILRGWLRAENTVYECLPESRRDNHFCRKISYFNFHNNPIPNGIAQIRTWWRRFVRTRYVGLNLESFWLRGTLEFRCAAGTVEFPKIYNWLRVTQAIVNAAIANRLNNIINDIESLIACLSIAAVATGTIKKCYCSKAVLRLFEGLPAATPKHDLVTMLWNHSPHLKRVSVETAVSDWRSWKRSIEQAQAAQNAQENSESDNAHLTWLRARHAKFNQIPEQPEQTIPF